MRAPLLRFGFLGLVVLVILGVTLAPAASDPTAPIRCLLCVDTLLADVIANVALYVPLGVAGIRLGWRWRSVLWSAAALSGAIELTQSLLPGRHATVVDVLANMVGAAVGATLAASADRWLRPPRVTADRLAAAAGLAILAIFASTGYLLEPVFPETRYWGQWTPAQGGLERYEGRVLRARVGGLPIAPQRLDRSDRVRALLRNGADARLRIRAGPEVGSLAPIFAIVDERRRRILFLGIRGDDLVLDVHRRAADFRLNHPSLRFPAIFEGIAPGDTVEVAVRRTPGAYCIDVGVDVGGAARSACASTRTPSGGWALLIQTPTPPSDLAPAMNTVWLILLLVPFGLWARRGPGTAFGAVLVLVGAIVLPAATSLVPAHPVELAGLALGAAAGRWIRVGGRRRG